jgi:hypothetical protein
MGDEIGEGLGRSDYGDEIPNDMHRVVAAGDVETGMRAVGFGNATRMGLTLDSAAQTAPGQAGNL